jgi:hypothetical protein
VKISLDLNKTEKALKYERIELFSIYFYENVFRNEVLLEKN